MKRCKSGAPNSALVLFRSSGSFRRDMELVNTAALPFIAKGLVPLHQPKLDDQQANAV